MKQSALLRRILSTKRSAVSEAKKQVPLQQLKERLVKAPPTRNFKVAITRRGAYDLRLIAELKKASPVKGVLRPKFEPALLAREFEAAGAAALSVLTDSKFFQGSMEYVAQAKASCSLPVLRKDFIIDEYQLYETRLAGADAVLIITQLMAQKKLRECIQTAMNLSLTPLVEVHTAAELKRAIDAGAEIIGINTRDLIKFKVDFEVAGALRPKVPADRLVVCESGVESSRQIDRLRELKFDAVLIGESLMRSRNPHGLIHELFFS